MSMGISPTCGCFVRIAGMNVTYPYLPEGRTIKYVPAHDRFMRAAEDACRELSTDHMHPTGAVMVRDGAVLARAANQSEPGA